MDSLVLELQREAMDSSRDLTALLRKTVVIATKLRVDKLLKWAICEQRGYGPEDDLPEYRRVSAELKVRNPYNGCLLPFIFKSNEPEYARLREIASSISQIEDLIKDRGDHLELQLPNELANHLMNASGAPNLPFSTIGYTSLVGILDAVRNAILEWSLTLERDGILGEGMTFNDREIKSANVHTYNIQNFSGIIGSVAAHNLNIRGFDDLRSQLKNSGVTQEQRNELEDVMDRIPKAHGEEKASLIKKAFQWTLNNSHNIGELSNAIHTWIGQNQS